MGILHLKWITESDLELREFRERFSEKYNDIEVGAVHPDRGTAYHYSSYYIQIVPKDFPPKIHFEYWADGWQGFLDLHLEPTQDNTEEMKVYRGIGINLMHILSDAGIECGERWNLTFGYFRISGIRSVDDLMNVFGRFITSSISLYLKYMRQRKAPDHCNSNIQRKTLNPILCVKRMRRFPSR